MPNALVFTVKDIVKIILGRRANKFDSNIAVTGQRGDGKSTLIAKILFRFKNFNPWKHQVYSREDAIKLLTTQKKGLCWDDEAINSGYKRDFQNKAQQDMIKFLTAYRDNFNVFASAIPSFFSLDKDLRDLYFIHLFVAERGIAHVHMPIQGRIYSQDRWDAANNAKIEAKWTQRIRKDPNFKPPFHKLTTFRGYLFFGDITPKQRKLCEDVKFEKRKVAFEDIDVKPDQLTFIQKMYKGIIGGKIDKDFLTKNCLLEGKKYSLVQSKLNTMLKDEGKGTLTQQFGRASRIEKEPKENKLSSLLPDF